MLLNNTKPLVRGQGGLSSSLFVAQEKHKCTIRIMPKSMYMHCIALHNNDIYSKERSKDLKWLGYNKVMEALRATGCSTSTGQLMVVQKTTAN